MRARRVRDRCCDDFNVSAGNCARGFRRLTSTCQGYVSGVAFARRSKGRRTRRILRSLNVSKVNLMSSSHAI